MQNNIYASFQKLIPELEKQTIPTSQDDFSEFYDWVNAQHSFFHYFELKEHYDNGIDENYYFKKFSVDTGELEKDIELAIDELWEQYEDEVSFGDQEDLMEQVEEIIFDKIKLAAVPHQLSLIVIYRENPYWLLVENTDEKFIQTVVDEFNEIFNKDGDLNMSIY